MIRKEYRDNAALVCTKQACGVGPQIIMMEAVSFEDPRKGFQKAAQSKPFPYSALSALDENPNTKSET